MNKEIIPIFEMSNAKPLCVTNEAVASILLKKKDSKGNKLYTESQKEAKAALAGKPREKAKEAKKK